MEDNKIDVISGGTVGFKPNMEEFNMQMEGVEKMVEAINDISEEKEENGDNKPIAVNWATKPDGTTYGPYVINRKYIRSLHSQMGKRVKRKKAFTMGYHSN